MSVNLRMSNRAFFCDYCNEGCDVFHKVGLGFCCSGCGAYHQGSFEVIEEAEEARIKALEDALEKISSLAHRKEYTEIVEIVNEMLGR